MQSFLSPIYLLKFEFETFSVGNAANSVIANGDGNTTAASTVGAKKYKMVLFEKAEWQFSEREKEAIEVNYFFIMVHSQLCQYSGMPKTICPKTELRPKPNKQFFGSQTFGFWMFGSFFC